MEITYLHSGLVGYAIFQRKLIASLKKHVRISYRDENGFDVVGMGFNKWNAPALKAAKEQLTYLENIMDRHDEAEYTMVVLKEAEMNNDQLSRDELLDRIEDLEDLIAMREFEIIVRHHGYLTTRYRLEKRGLRIKHLYTNLKSARPQNVFHNVMKQADAEFNTLFVPPTANHPDNAEMRAIWQNAKNRLEELGLNTKNVPFFLDTPTPKEEQEEKQ